MAKEYPLDTATFSLDTEKAVLGAFLLDDESRLFYEAAAAGLVADDFHLDSNRVIYRAICDLIEEEVPIDMITLVNYLSSDKSLERIGDVAYIASLTQGVPERPSLGHYVEILKDRSLRRQALVLSRTLAAQASDPGDSIRDALAGAHEDVLRLQGAVDQKTITPLAEITGTVLGNIERMMSYHPDQTIGVPFGLADLDESTTGMREGQLVVVGGFPKSGKTSFAIDTVRKAAKSGIPIGFFSREMLKEELIERLLSQESEVSYLKIRKPMHLTISEFRALQDAKAKIDTWPLFIDDSATHINEMVPRSHLLIRKHKVLLLVFDYIQIINAPGEKEFERVTYVANALTSLGKKTKVPIMALSQLTPPEGQKGRINIMPNMGMLRSSGQIAQNSHLILFTYHPVDKDTGDPSGEDLIIVGAQRAGPTGRVKAFFNVGNQRWEPRGVAAIPVPTQEKIFPTQQQEEDW